MMSLDSGRGYISISISICIHIYILPPLVNLLPLQPIADLHRLIDSTLSVILSPREILFSTPILIDTDRRYNPSTTVGKGYAYPLRDANGDRPLVPVRRQLCTSQYTILLHWATGNEGRHTANPGAL